MTSASELVEIARDAQKYSHSPYSEFALGAALETDSGIYKGTNIENVNYSNTIHAEEVALVQAHLNDATEYLALAVVTEGEGGIPPCGRCRQSLAEFCPMDMPIFTAKDGDITSRTLGDLLPEPMLPSDVLEQDTN